MAVPFPGDRRRHFLDGWLPGAVLLLVGLFLGWNRWVEHRELTRAEGERLAVQLRAADENLSRQLIGAHVALLGLREDVLRWGPEERLAIAGRRLQVLADAMPGLRTITLHDADGRVTASSRDEPSGSNAADRLSLKSARAGADPTLLYVSPPYRSAAGVYSTRRTLWVLDADGRFDGTVTATLDPEYFGLVLRSLLYAPDMRATLTHGDGSTVVAMPPEESAPAASAGPRLVVQQSLRPSAVPMDRPLLLAVSRDRAAMMAPWAAQTRLFAALYAALVAGTGGALWLQRRRQRELQALAAEQEARQRADAERLQRALQGADLGLWELDLRTRSAAVDARWAALLGYTPQDAPGEEAGWKALLHPDDRGRVIRAQEDHIAGRSEAFEAVYRLRHRDGHWIWVLDRGKVLERDAAGTPLRMVGTHMDISARMRDQEALQRSEQNLAITLDSIGEAVIATDAGGRVTRMNPAAERLTGWPAQQAICHALADVYRRVAARTRVPLPDPVAQVLARGETVDGGDDVLLLARDGRELRVADSVSPIRAPSGEVQGVVLVGSDVTERERVQRALHERELQLSRVTDALPGPVVRLSRSGHCLFVNHAYERWFGVRAVAIVGRLQREVLDAANAAAVEAAEPLRRVRAGETVQFEAPLHSADGGLRHTLVTLVPDRDTDGSGRGHFAVFTDISERRQSEARLRAAQDELEAVLAALPDLLFEVGLDGFIHRFHSPRSDLLYMPPEHFLGRRVSEVLPPSALEAVQAALAQAYREGHSNGQQYALDLPQGRRCFELSVALKALDPAEGPRLVVLARDVTERNQAAAERLSLERQLREAQKMESIGTLAGGIAHDFNNIVAAILGNVALLREDLAREHPAQHGLEQVQRAGLRARTLVQQILAFSRR
ncbi:MAG TPA: PAS domain-containing protein, partial [Rubrivivax sp.]|nr:PAS domain-containing protein [Rubrivivax sp.]